MVSEQLKGHDLENRREQIGRGGDFDHVVRDLADLGIAFRHDGQHFALARFDFLNVRERLLVEKRAFGAGGIVGREHDDREILVDERVGPVLHLARGITFGVDVGNFLQLERAFEGDGEMNAAPEDTENRWRGKACVPVAEDIC